MAPCSEVWIEDDKCELDRAVFTLESPLEHMARSRPVTEGVRHLEEVTVWRTEEVKSEAGPRMCLLCAPLGGDLLKLN